MFEGKPDGAMRGGSRVIRRLILCACAAGGFAAMAAVLHQALPLQVAEVTPKLNYLAAHRADFDTVFIGSSRIYHGVSPKAFDAAMAAAGRPTRSFNLGIDGLMPPESLRMTRRILAMQPPRLRTIFLEVASAQHVPDLNQLTVRDVYSQDTESVIHGLKQALLDFQSTPREARWQRASGDVSRSIVIFARNELNIGRLAPEPDATEEPQHFGTMMLGPDADGYIPALNTVSKASRLKIETQMDLIRKGMAKERPRDEANEDGYANIRDLLKTHGVELILITAPVLLRDYHARVDAPPGARLLAFDEPARLPDLYEPGHRSDSDHLNYLGARLFSKDLADSYLSAK